MLVLVHVERAGQNSVIVVKSYCMAACNAVLPTYCMGVRMRVISMMDANSEERWRQQCPILPAFG